MRERKDKGWNKHVKLTVQEELELRRSYAEDMYYSTKRIAKILLHERRIRNLSAREYTLAKERLVNQKSLDELSKKYGVTRHRLRQVEDKYMKWLVDKSL